jgi:AcrR family transcriptional regulator
MAKTTATKRGTPPRARRARGELSRERIIEAALAKAERGLDLDEITMRELAAELGVGTMTLYGYFRSKLELIDATFDRASDEVTIPPRTGSWKDQLRALCREMHRVLRKYPTAVQVRARRPLLGSGVLRTGNAGLGIMLEAGFDKREATRAWRSLFTYTFGSVAFTPESVSAEVQREWRARLASLDAAELPWLTDAAPEAAEAMSGGEQFRNGLDLILDGLELRLGASGDR